MNDQTRLLIAIVLTFVVVFLWSYLFSPKSPQKSPVKQEEIAEQNNRNSIVIQRQKPSKQLEVFKEKSRFPLDAKKYPKITVDTPLYRAVFCSKGGLLEEFILKRYKESIKPGSLSVKLIRQDLINFGPLGIMWEGKPLWKSIAWSFDHKNLELREGEKKGLTFKTEGGDIDVIRKFIFNGDTYEIVEEVTIVSKKNERGKFSLVLATKPLVANKTRFNKTHIIYYDSKKVLHKKDKLKDLKKGITSESPVFWCGIDSNYFLIAAVPMEGGSFNFYGKYADKSYLVSLNREVNLSLNKPKSFKFYYYFGPKLEGLLKDAPYDLKAAIDYGWFDIIAKPLVKVLNFFYRYVGNYGLAIILLTIVIKIIFWPLSHKSYKSMEKMKKIQPILKKLKEQYKDDRQRMNQELMRVYKTYKINPAGGCLPMLLQIPVFIGLYEALLGATELRHAPFITHIPFTNILWLADLSAKDPLYISPIIMGITMYLQQKLSPSSGDPTQAKIMLIMPIFLTFLFLNFPSGLVIYFITNNVLSTIQQWWMLRKS